MSNFIEDLMGSIGNDGSKELSSKTGINQSLIAKMIPQVAPLILGGLKKQRDERGGDDRVDHILNKYGSASVLDNLGDLLPKLQIYFQISLNWMEVWLLN